MATKAQILANRQNAQESTGPRTTEGKATVSQNAVKHGLTAQKTVIPGENLADFELYHYEMLEELDPVGPMESMLADRIVSLSWRLKRTVRIQNETIDALLAPKPLSALDKLTKSMVRQVAGKFEPDQDEASPLGRTVIKDFSNARVLDRLMMYERRIENSLYKTVQELQKLSLIRKLDSPQATAEIPHKTPPSLGQPPHNNQLPIISNQSSPPFMQNKPNLPNAGLNLTSYKQSNYQQNPLRPVPPKQTQIKPNPTHRIFLPSDQLRKNRPSPARKIHMETQNPPQRPIKNKAACFFMPNMLLRGVFSISKAVLA